MLEINEVSNMDHLYHFIRTLRGVPIPISNYRGHYNAKMVHLGDYVVIISLNLLQWV